MAATWDWVSSPEPPFSTRAVEPSKDRPSAVEMTPSGIWWVDTVTPVSSGMSTWTPDRSTS